MPEPVELDRGVESAVRAQIADDAQGEVLGRHAQGQVAVQRDADRLGDAQPEFAGGPQRRHLAAADAGAERAHPAEVRRVRVRAQDELAGQHHGLLAQHLMADAAADVEEIADALLGHEGADLGMVLGVARRRRGHGMVQRDGQTLGDQHALLAELLPDAPDGGRVVVAEHDVGPRVDHLADFDDVEAGSAGQGFLGECLWSGRLFGHLCNVSEREFTMTLRRSAITFQEAGSFLEGWGATLERSFRSTD